MNTRVNWIGVGAIALGLYGFVATLHPEAHLGRIVAAYGAVFVADSLTWGMLVDAFRPDRRDTAGALVCLAGVGNIMCDTRPSVTPALVRTIAVSPGRARLRRLTVASTIR